MEYILGLDIGITSVGWAVLNMDDQRIEKLGVRIFTAAEQPKTGESLALPRRTARGTRRRLRRRAGRMRNMKKLFVKYGLATIADLGLDDKYEPLVNKKSILETNPDMPTPWELRVLGLEQKLNGAELARALFHIGKHRGFKSNRKNVSETDEDGKVKEAIRANQAIMAEKEYRTIGELFAKDEKFADTKRNTTGDYKGVASRIMLEEEIREIFKCQRKYHNNYATEEFENDFIACFNQQKPVASGDDILRMLGKCTFEKEEYRAPKKAYTAEMCALWGKLNSLWYYQDGKQVYLTPEQRSLVAQEAIDKKELKYSHLRKILKLGAGNKFAGLQYRPKKSNANATDETIIKETEEVKFYKLTGYHEIKDAFKDNPVWDTIKTDAVILDTIAEALTYFKTDEDITRYLKSKNIADNVIESALNVKEMDKSANLSLKAMYKILPFLQQNKMYNEACALAGYNHSMTHDGKKSFKLPPIDRDSIRNPVVIRALAQSRKVVNAIIDQFGSPTRIHIELAREMSKNFRERREIETSNKENEAANDRLDRDLQELFGNSYRPNGLDRLKMRLYREQSGQCAYSGKPIDLQRLREDGYVQVDHILPYSRSFDDSMANKALVLASENQHKRNRTPYEYINEDKPAYWDDFENWVRATIKHPRKRVNLLLKNLDQKVEEEFKQRNLNDTQWIAREFMNHLKNNLLFAHDDNKERVVCIKGQMTSMLRREWGIRKDREESHLHHAMDAAVVASITPKIRKWISDFRKKEENYEFQDKEASYSDPETGEIISIYWDKKGKLRMPQPWPQFRDELLMRCTDDPQTMLKFNNIPNYTAEDIEKVKPIFVSYMPQRRMSGQLHQETLKSARLIKEKEKREEMAAMTGEKNAEEKNYAVKRIALTDLTAKNIEMLIARDDDRAVYDTIIARLQANEWDAKKAFKEPIYKPLKSGAPGPIIKKVKIKDATNSVYDVRKGVADKGDQLFIDIFTKNGKFYCVPAYVEHFMKKELPQRAVSAKKLESDWLTIDAISFEYKFRLSKYDLVRIVVKNNEIIGYYNNIHRWAGTIMLINPKNGEEINIGVTLAQSFEKLSVDILGNYYQVKSEKRLDFSQSVYDSDDE